MKTILQIPLNTDLRDGAAKEADRQGFSSLQEAVRIFLKKMADQQISVNFEEKTSLSPQAVKRYDRMVDEVKSGKVKTKIFSDTKSLMKYLENED
ncbi:hypothetical protein HYT02_00495 [Candidatus Gottesmanbacteria bacterium]|nr:hypothetical protein [Candidatus Gottesmanbacteria bacterium]